MAIGNPRNCTKPWRLGNQNGFVRFPRFTCHDTGASRACILGGRNLDLTDVSRLVSHMGPVTGTRTSTLRHCILIAIGLLFLDPLCIRSPARAEGNTLAYAPP